LPRKAIAPFDRIAGRGTPRHLYVVTNGALQELLGLLASGEIARRAQAEARLRPKRKYRKWDTRPIPLDPDRMAEISAKPDDPRNVQALLASLDEKRLRVRFAAVLAETPPALRAARLEPFRTEAKRRRIRLGFPRGRKPSPLTMAREALAQASRLIYVDWRQAAARLMRQHEGRGVMSTIDVLYGLEEDLSRYGRVRGAPHSHDVEILAAAISAVTGG
jgi:hypothetical protein